MVVLGVLLRCDMLVDNFYFFTVCFFFFKQKTAYEMRISDWSSDVCSSDLPELSPTDGTWRRGDAAVARALKLIDQGALAGQSVAALAEIGRASCRERVCQYV